MSRNYHGQRVYVVGGSMGIGLAAAEAFAARGAEIVLFARGVEKLEQAVLRVRAAALGDEQRVEFRVLDVTATDEVGSILDDVVAGFGAPDVLVNCAGRARPDYFEKIDAEQFRETLAVNLHGIWNVTQALLPHMKENGGIIVNTASLTGLIGIFGYTDYSAAKFAVVGLSEALRAEVKRHGIQVFVLCPSDTDTPGFAEENREKPPETHAVSEGVSLATPETVASALLSGIEGRQMLIFPGSSARWTARAKRLVPGIVEWVTDRAARRASGGSSQGPR